MLLRPLDARMGGGEQLGYKVDRHRWGATQKTTSDCINQMDIPPRRSAARALAVWRSNLSPPTTTAWNAIGLFGSIHT